MLFALLIYCYANGIFGSRRIERAAYRDIAVRYLTADTHPDHDTICKFRRENFAAVSTAFLSVLKLAHELKLLKVGTVSIDVTHIKPNASKHHALSYARACELEQQLKLEIAELMARAESADSSSEARRLPKNASAAHSGAWPSPGMNSSPSAGTVRTAMQLQKLRPASWLSPTGC